MHARAASRSDAAERRDGYVRRKPEDGVLCRVVQEHWPAVRERAEEQEGLPRFVVLHDAHRVKEIHVYDFDYVTVAERLAQLGPAGSKALPIICHVPDAPDRLAWTFEPNEILSEAVKVEQARARRVLDT